MTNTPDSVATNPRLPVVEGVPDFWTRVRSAEHRLLGLDYDGTLAPFHVMREAAVPLPGVKDLLLAIARETDTSVLLVSGRPAVQVQKLLACKGSGLPIIGAHGFELIRADGSAENTPPNETQRQGLARAWDLAISAGQAAHLEHKIASISLHTREVTNAADIEAAVQAQWLPVAERYDLDIMHFNGGLELRARSRNKGIAFAAQLATLPPGTLPVYIGDDATDEDVFHILRDSGIGIKVGDTTQPTEAAGCLRDPEAVLQLLRGWRLVVEPSTRTNKEP